MCLKWAVDREAPLCSWRGRSVAALPGWTSMNTGSGTPTTLRAGRNSMHWFIFKRQTRAAGCLSQRIFLTPSCPTMPCARPAAGAGAPRVVRCPEAGRAHVVHGRHDGVLGRTPFRLQGRDPNRSDLSSMSCASVSASNYLSQRLANAMTTAQPPKQIIKLAAANADALNRSLIAASRGILSQRCFRQTPT